MLGPLLNSFSTVWRMCLNVREKPVKKQKSFLVLVGEMRCIFSRQVLQKVYILLSLQKILKNYGFVKPSIPNSTPLCFYDEN